MPISNDGTITPAQQTWVTRVVVEVTYALPTERRAQAQHDNIVGAILEASEAFNEDTPLQFNPWYPGVVSVSVANAKNPRPLPEPTSTGGGSGVGEGAEGGSHAGQC